MSKKTVVVFLALFAAFVVRAADAAASSAVKLPSPVPSVEKQSGLEKEAVKTSDAADAAVKTAEKKKNAPPVKPVEKKKSASSAKTAEKKKAAEPVKASQLKKDFSLEDVTTALSVMTPMMGLGIGDVNVGELISKEDAIRTFQDLLDLYREASPEEKQQVVLAVTMMQALISGLSVNAGMLLQQMPDAERKQVIDSASASAEILAAVQKEMNGKMTDEEKTVFGGLIQTILSFCEAFSKAAK
ncbi:MAG: hypothetical protein J6T99_09225 [Oscillospiraceae bacterium]|nr:hypothetical protein [Oscillospiraceae bacterium]